MSRKKLSVVERTLLDAIAKHTDGAATSDIQPYTEGLKEQDVGRAIGLLIKKNLIEPLKIGNRQLYKPVKQEEADKVGSLEAEEKMVYQHIKASGNEGIWVRTIKSRTNLHQNVFAKALKALEQRQLIKPIKSVKFPQRKTYMLFELQPSQEVTGGPWFTDQELDTDFIESISKSCLLFIARSSFPNDRTAIFPPSYNGYPTATKIRRYIKKSRIANIDLTLSDITSLLDTLIYDGKIERISMPIEGLLMHDDDDDDMGAGDDDDMEAEDEWMYRAAKERLRKGSEVYQVPCGACPVRDRCFDTGIISPYTCEYLKAWLDF